VSSPALVDTSVWIAAFSRTDPLDLQAHLDLEDVVTCLPVVQEVLQGFRDEAAFRKARQAMLNFPRVEDPLSLSLVEEAVSLFRAGRCQGLTVRSSVDCLIAACALRHDLEILHRDRDFTALAQISGLRQRAL